MVVKTIAVSSRKNSDANSIRNTILLALPRGERDALRSQLQLVPIPTHTVLNEIAQPITFAYFINDGLASILCVMADGKSVEVGLTGKEGFVGLPLTVGFRTSPARVIMQIEGSAFKISAEDFHVVLRGSPTLEKLLHRHSQNMTLQARQCAACNRLHEVDRRLARWLLMSRDRIGSDMVPLTQEYLAHMLGTRRASVSIAAGILQRAGLISYSRGQVEIRNVSKLKDTACECYEMMRKQSLSWQNEAK